MLQGAYHALVGLAKLVNRCIAILVDVISPVGACIKQSRPLAWHQYQQHHITTVRVFEMQGQWLVGFWVCYIVRLLSRQCDVLTRHRSFSQLSPPHLSSAVCVQALEQAQELPQFREVADSVRINGHTGQSS